MSRRRPRSWQAAPRTDQRRRAWMARTLRGSQGRHKRDRQRRRRRRKQKEERNGGTLNKGQGSSAPNHGRPQTLGATLRASLRAVAGSPIGRVYSNGPGGATLRAHLDNGRRVAPHTYRAPNRGPPHRGPPHRGQFLIINNNARVITNNNSRK